MIFGAIDKFVVIRFFSSVDGRHLVQLPAVALPSATAGTAQHGSICPKAASVNLMWRSGVWAHE